MKIIIIFYLFFFSCTINTKEKKNNAFFGEYYSLKIGQLSGTWVDARISSDSSTRQELFRPLSGFTISVDQNDRIKITTEYFEHQYYDQFDSLTWKKDISILIDSCFGEQNGQKKFLFLYDSANELISDFQLVRAVFEASGGTHIKQKQYTRVTDSIIDFSIEQFAMGKYWIGADVKVKYNEKVYNINLKFNKRLYKIVGLPGFSYLQIVDRDKENPKELSVALSSSGDFKTFKLLKHNDYYLLSSVPR
jgi:hypothetical protein